MNNIYVVNKKDHAPTDTDYYIGRGSVFGNPFTSKDLDKTKAEFQATSKEDSLDKYNNYIRVKINLKEASLTVIFDEILEVLKTKDVYLVCYCAPKECHGDILKKIIVGTYLSRNFFDNL